jgi:sugar phosphate isomerase/epimerase
MKILFFCPRWGQENASWGVFLEKVKQSGYDGVEASLPLAEEEKEEMFNGLAKHGLQFIGQHWETVAPDFEEHKRAYRQRLESLAIVKPLFINSQTGKDYYSFQQNAELFRIADGIAKETGIPVFHETHRGKFSFAAHVTRHYLEQLPVLELTLDISHWCAVAETLLHDQSHAIEIAVTRTRHLHARIGHPQGAQITDPRAPEWNEALQFHLSCWDKVIDYQEKAGSERFTITCEFGPFPYMTQLPFTRQPLTDQWEINLYMKDLLKERYKS